MIERGAGPALILVPGLPGPWKFVAPAVRALSAHFRVLTMSLGPECTLDSDVHRMVAALDERGIDRATICGTSFGALVALRFAARHPDRTSALVLASPPGPGFELRPRYRFYTRWPRIFGPLFVLETPYRLRREIRWRHLLAMTMTPVSFSKMARRARLMESVDIAADCRRVAAPTLVVTGEGPLDDVVDVASSKQYLHAIPGARHAVLEGTGHIGLVTRPDAFARLVATAF